MNNKKDVPNEQSGKPVKDGTSGNEEVTVLFRPRTDLPPEQRAEFMYKLKRALDDYLDAHNHGKQK